MGGPHNQMIVTLFEMWDLLFLFSLDVYVWYGQWAIRFGLEFMLFDISLGACKSLCRIPPSSPEYLGEEWCQPPAVRVVGNSKGLA
jgi:hypothetical protein